MSTTTKDSKRILSVTTRRLDDDSPDTSWLGEYSDDPGDFAIVNRGEHEGTFVDDLPCECGHPVEQHGEEDYAQCSVNDCDCDAFDRVGVERGRSYRYFNPNHENYKGSTEEEIAKYCRQDYDRMTALSRGDFCFIGIQARATIQLTGGATQRITSGGLWGIESDAGDYLVEVEDEQLAELRTELHAIGFSKRAIGAAFRNVERRVY